MAIVCSNNTKLCYDQIVHWVATQSMYWCGVPKPALVCMFTTLQNLQHHIHTLFGNLEIWGSTNIWVVPVLGIVGQGNRAGPQIWAVISTPILELLKEEGFGIAFKASISGTPMQFIGYSFMDNMCLI